MSAKLSEIEVLKIIDDSLEHLTLEEKQRVFHFIGSKHSITPTSSAAPIRNSGIIAGSSNGNDTENITDIKQFIALKKPKGFYEQIVCLGYYLEKHQGIKKFGTAEITTANTDARALKIPNPSLYLSDAALKYGYFTAVGGGKKALTARGEAVVEALPDRDAVKIAHDNHPMKKKAASKKKKTAKK